MFIVSYILYHIYIISYHIYIVQIIIMHIYIYTFFHKKYINICVVLYIYKNIKKTRLNNYLLACEL